MTNPRKLKQSEGVVWPLKGCCCDSCVTRRRMMVELCRKNGHVPEENQPTTCERCGAALGAGGEK